MDQFSGCQLQRCKIFGEMWYDSVRYEISQNFIVIHIDFFTFSVFLSFIYHFGDSSQQHIVEQVATEQ